MNGGDGNGRLWRFLAVGLSNTVVSFSAFQLVIGQLGQPASRAQAVAYAAGIAWSFFWNRRWTFRHSGAALPALASFLALQLFLLLFSSALLGLLVDVRGLPPTLTWIWVMALVTGLGFLGSSRLVFRPVNHRKRRRCS